MKQEEIIEGNILIARFMGYKTYKELQTLPEEDKFLSDCFFMHDNADFNFNWEPESLRYQSDWNWLMKVVEKIESLDYDPKVTHTYSVDISGNGTTIQPNTWAGERWMIRHNKKNERKMCTWLCVVDFIKFYNKKNK
jgi:hypothetical protein